MPISTPHRIPEIPATKLPVVSGGAYENVLIARMSAKADLSSVVAMPRGAERKAAAYDALLATAQSSQADAIVKLKEMQAAGEITSFESMYLPNAIVVRAADGKSQAVAEALKGFANIDKVVENRTWKLPPEARIAIADASTGAAQIGAAVPAPEWGVAKIGAPAAWAQGYDGTGITVGVVDTGFDPTHPALKGAYRGTNADGTFTNDYNWFDGTSKRSATPYDDGDHGSHCAGTIAGGTATRAIGVAPGAKIIASKAILASGYNTTEATLKALQWMLAPTDSNGLNPDPRKGAGIVSNSWGNADKTDQTFVDTWNGFLAAGIEPVTAAGNDGSRAGSISPPGSLIQGISVGATDSNDRVAGFSSRGPSAFDPTMIMPYLSAPGVNVVSSIPGGRYASYSGTSMATPHTAGAMAILLQAKPTATHDEIVGSLQNTATDIDAKGPDMNAGFGRINVDKAVAALLAGGSASARPNPRVPRPAVAAAA